MITHVVDASVFGPFFFDDEKDEMFAELPQLIARELCIVPQHWRLEVTNQILVGLRRKRTTSALAIKALIQIDNFSIAADDETAPRMTESFALAHEYGLTIYDAAYLELAIRRNLSLVTNDIDLRKAAKVAKLVLLPA
jgi:predicted nucleic acid-binding protein